MILELHSKVESIAPSSCTVMPLTKQHVKTCEMDLSKAMDRKQDKSGSRNMCLCLDPCISKG